MGDGKKVFVELTSDLKNAFRIFVRQLVKFTLLWFPPLIIIFYRRQPTPQEGLSSAVLTW